MNYLKPESLERFFENKLPNRVNLTNLNFPQANDEVFKILCDFLKEAKYVDFHHCTLHDLNRGELKYLANNLQNAEVIHLELNHFWWQEEDLEAFFSKMKKLKKVWWALWTMAYWDNFKEEAFLKSILPKGCEIYDEFRIS